MPRVGLGRVRKILGRVGKKSTKSDPCPTLMGLGMRQVVGFGITPREGVILGANVKRPIVTNGDQVCGIAASSQITLRIYCYASQTFPRRRIVSPSCEISLPSVQYVADVWRKTSNRRLSHLNSGCKANKLYYNSENSIAAHEKFYFVGLSFVINYNQHKDINSSANLSLTLVYRISITS